MTESAGYMENVLTWLHKGYPEGVPPKDYFALLALLKRSLSEDEVIQAAQAILRANDGDTPVTEGEIPRRGPVDHREGTEPRRDPAGGLAPGFGRLAVGHTGALTSPRNPRPSSHGAGDSHCRVSRRSGWVSGTWTKISVMPSGSVTCISCRPHGSCVAARAIATPRPSSSAWVA